MNIMKSMISKLVTATLLAAAIAGATSTVRAADDTNAAPAKKEKSSADKFYGPITALDTNAMTFTVNDQVYTVTAKTEMTSAKDGSTVTLAAATVGEPARGSFVKNSDGKMEVTKVRFGKKSGGAGGKGGKKKKDSTDSTASQNPPATPQN